MLNGLLNRGFSSKCKSSIKLTTRRIDEIRRKRNATQKFLRNDVADLLADGFNDNALGRAERLIRELSISSCYDFIERSCNCILQHLSEIQKQSECPEECRMAVASLMFAAARFSDLPELRELRHIFQERYGNSLECFANKEFVENLGSKSPMLEAKVKLMLEIASEFSIKWDGAAFGYNISKPPPVSSLNEVKTYGASPNATESKIPNAKDDSSPLPKTPPIPEKANPKDDFSPLPKDDSFPLPNDDSSPLPKTPCSHEKLNTAQEPKPQRISTTPPPYQKPQTNKTTSDPDAVHGKPISLPSSRRRHGHNSQKRKPKSKPRLGLQLLADDRRDEDEKMLDKLLIRYSHKQSSYDPEKVRDNLDSNRPRSKSLPKFEEVPKVFSRAASLEPACHLHPKLPDYDDLVANLAAMKVNNKV